MFLLKRIKLILTGGTIGSRIDERGNISPSAEPMLLKYCSETIKYSAEFEVSEPFSVLSENMTASHREALIKELLKLEKCPVDGVIVAHGSDTLCYTAALISMATRHLPFPIVFIASDKVLSDPASNGRANFESAVTLIKSSTLHRGTFICYRDKSGENSVYLGTRLCSAEPIFDSFLPFDGSRLGVTQNGDFYPENTPLINEINREKEAVISGDFKLSDDILLTFSSPCFYPERLNLEGITAVINYGYHCGTGNEKGLLALAENCKKADIPLYLASFKDKDAPVYESLAELLKMENVKRLYNISPESAAAKVCLAHSVNPEILEKNLFFEEIC